MPNSKTNLQFTLSDLQRTFPAAAVQAEIGLVAKFLREKRTIPK